MMVAEDFRRIARNALRGKWFLAIVAGILASLLGGLGGNGPELKWEINEAGMHTSLEYANQTIFSTNSGLKPEWAPWIIGGATYVALIALVLAVAYYVLGSIIQIGYARFNLDMIDVGEARIENLFAYFKYWQTTVAAKFLQGLYIFLWSLLLIIPGIIAAYSYAMTDYILAEHPELTASEAIARSKEMMSCNKFRLFCLQLSFIGWGILCLFTFGIGNLWLKPYMQAATAAFYREISTY